MVRLGTLGKINKKVPSWVSEGQDDQTREGQGSGKETNWPQPRQALTSTLKAIGGGT